MSYVDEVFAQVAAKNANEPEFIQAVTEVLESLRVVIEANEEKYRKDALLELAKKDGISLGGRLEDCGTLVFDREKQDVHAGGSGCGCSAVTLCGHIFRRFRQGELKRVLFMATGALLSPTSNQQGDTIPGIAHAIALEADS